jgi:endonuclease/exonuclease/phosphatase family metal-dependent hydrolase
MRPRHLAIAYLLGLGACAHGMNYTDPAGPRFSGAPATPVASASADGVMPVAHGRPGRIRVATFNIAWALKMDEAIALIQADSGLRDADVLMLQEMDEPSAAHAAQALGMYYVYYPATLHPKTGRDFGNALLSRWPIERDTKLVLPHLSWQRKTQRIAVLGTIQVGTERVLLVAPHLGTLVEILPSGQRDQARTILDAVEPYNRVIVAGDFNSGGLGKLFTERGFSWPTQGLGPTHHFWTFDHVYARGFVPVGRGIVTDVDGVSDHRPVWADLAWEPTPTPAVVSGQ